MVGFNCFPKKTKRNEIDRGNDEFSDFSLSAPARKIRRLDLNLPPIMEEDEIQSAPVDKENSIVPFKPLQHDQPSSGHLFVDKDLVLGLKNRFRQEAEVFVDLYDEQPVVPWNPTQFQCYRSTDNYEDPPPPKIVELDGDDVMMEDADMDVEEENNNISNSNSVSLPQWQQQQQLHCMMPQVPQANSSPIIWYL